MTTEDVHCLEHWSRIFGDGFVPAFAFLFWCDTQPPDALFLEVFEHAQRWYAVQAVRLSDYRLHMKQRSVRWETVDIPAAVFNRVSQPLKDLL